MSSLTRLIDADAPARLRAHDATLFSDDPAVQAEAGAFMGWTHLGEAAESVLPQIERLAGDALCEGTTDVALLGMGGSSLAALVMSRVLPDGGARLHVLDTTSPATVARALAELDPATTLYLVSSKSGGTIEPNSLAAIFHAAAAEKLGAEAAGKRFVAVTDPGSSLEEHARAKHWRATISTPPSVGGRFSALTAFGLLPAALTGADVRELTARARAMEAACALPPAENPGATLAAFIGDAHAAGHDKLTVVASPALGSFGLWVEQLVAESLGKLGRGVVPVVELATGTPYAYGPDRAVVVVRYESDARLAEWAEDQKPHRPVTQLVLRDPLDLGAEFVRWEYAIALVGFLLGVNPFDQPNVAEAKAATNAVLDGSAAPLVPTVAVDDTYVTFAGGLAVPTHTERSAATAAGHAIAALGAGDYLAILAYLPDDAALLEPLRLAVPRLAEQTGAAVCLELGPRYLHSTGQLHKGGPDSGVFVLITTRDDADVAVPGQEWGLRALHRAQAEGDLVTLAAYGRRTLRLDLLDASPECVAACARALLDGAGVVAEL